jgi:hypothetical protein
MAFPEGLVGTLPGGQGGAPSSDTKFTFSRPSIRYEHPFLDMTSTMLPKSIKGMIKFICTFIISDGFLNQCIKKMAEYPITDLVFTDTEKVGIDKDNTESIWKKILIKQLKLKQTMHQIGMDYNGYGNSIVSINFPFRRIVTCKECKARTTPESVKEVAFKEYEYEGYCPECVVKTKFDYEDVPTQEINKLRFIHWELPLIDIKFNNTTGEHFYYYAPPLNIIKAVNNGDLDIVNSTRKELIEVIRKGTTLKLESETVIHFKMPSPQHLIFDERGWGVPQVMVVMKDVFHNKILKKGNEMIAFDHIVPWRILYPIGTGDISPYSTVNLASWKTKIEEEIRKFRVDPNYTSIMPLPIGYINVGGDGKLLLTTNEVKAGEDTIITGLGIIPEIIRGGASWSGSNVSLRIVENSFLNWRATMQDFIDMVVETCANYFGIPKISVTMSKFKMADEMSKVSLMANLASAPPADRKVSGTTVVEELGLDPKIERKNIEDEINNATKLMIRSSEISAIAQGNASLINSRYNADSQAEYNMRNDSNYQKYQEIKAKNDNLALDKKYNDIRREVGGTENISIPQVLMNVTIRMQQIASIAPEEFKGRMLVIKNTMPNLYSEIYKNLTEMNVIAGDLLGNVPQPTQEQPPEQSQPPSGQDQPIGQAMPQPLPEQRPPRSDNAQI